MDEGLESCLVEIGLEMEGARGYDGWLDLSCRPPVGTVSCAFTVTLNGARCFYRLHNISRFCLRFDSLNIKRRA